MPKINKTKNNYLIRLVEYSFVLFILFLSASNISNYFNNKEVLGAKTENVNLVNEKIIFLKSIAENNPLYFDACTELVQLNIEESNINEANKYFEIAQKINPNSQIIKSFKEILNNLN